MGVDAGAGTGGQTIQDAAAGNDDGDGDGDDGSRALDPVCVQGGSPTRGFCDLIVDGEGLDQFEGMLVSVRSGSPPFQRLSSGQARVIDGKFSITLPQAQETDIIFKVTTIHFDTDGDGACGPADQVYRASAVGATIADGGRPICPWLVHLNSRNPADFSAATAAFCQGNVDLCQPADGGPADGGR